MPIYELDHVTLGVRNLYEAAHRLREETGLETYEGGWLRRVPGANRVVPLPGDACISLECMIDHHQPLPPGPARFRTWYERSVMDGKDRWMNWCLRVDSREELERIADRFGTPVVDDEGRIAPDGTVGVHLIAPLGHHLTWAKGLPSWYFTPDMAAHPARVPVAHRHEPLEISWLELGNDPAEVEEHIGAETFAALPLRFAEGDPGLLAIGIATADGGEIVIRKQSAAPLFAELFAADAA